MSYAASSSVRVVSNFVCLLLLNGVLTAQELPDFAEALKVAKLVAPLTNDERALAVRLSEEALRANKLLPDKKTFLTSAQIHRNIEAERDDVFERHALLTYYRYAGDMAVLAYVNLARRTVKVEQIPHFPASIAPEELQRAKELAFGHPELKSLLEPFRGRVEVEPVLMQSLSPKDPLFGHRLLNLLFRVGPRYLTAPGVLVDLTTDKVTITRSPQKDTHPHGR